MAVDVFRLPWLGTELPKPRLWDLAALGVLLIGAAIAAFNLRAALGAPPGEAVSGTLTGGLVILQLAIASGSLLILGKTAKHGTLWGNLLAVAGMMVGISGVLLAAALWAAA